MADDRVCCLTPGCGKLIQPATATRTGGYCGPCDGKRKKAEREEFIRLNRRDVDLFAGVNDPVEIIQLLHTERKHDPLIHYLPPPRPVDDLYLSLTEHEVERLASLAAAALQRGEDSWAEEVALNLAAFTDFKLDAMLKVWLDMDCFWPSMAFRSAGPEIRDGILKKLSRGEANANHALQAAAWIGDPAIAQAFASFDADPPPWAKKLHIPPSDYARCAGWELVTGRRRNLTLEQCFEMHVTPSGLGSPGIEVGKESTDLCPWCDRPLLILLRIRDHAEPFNALGLSGDQIEFMICDTCSGFGITFGQLDLCGHSSWSAQNSKPKNLPVEPIAFGPSPWIGQHVQLRPRRPIQAADWVLPSNLNQIGGLPAWVQDAEYPRCRQCGQTMIFIAQFDNGTLKQEGMHYLFLCQACRVTAAGYQQS